MAAHILHLDSIHSRYYGKAQIDLVETFDQEKILNMTKKFISDSSTQEGHSSLV